MFISVDGEMNLLYTCVFVNICNSSKHQYRRPKKKQGFLQMHKFIVKEIILHMKPTTLHSSKTDRVPIIQIPSSKQTFSEVGTYQTLYLYTTYICCNDHPPKTTWIGTLLLFALKLHLIQLSFHILWKCCRQVLIFASQNVANFIMTITLCCGTNVKKNQRHLVCLCPCI